MLSNKGLWFFNEGDKGTFQTVPLTNLTDRHVRIQAEYSSINYKDALGVTGKGKIFRSYPIVPGIDVAGTVYESQSSQFQKGDRVIVTGCGLGENYSGGYQQFVDVPAENVIHSPLNFSAMETMIIGTAGFTAALALHRMEKLDQNPDKGPILVTGASGGVGSVAVKLFSKKGYEVIAQSEKPDSKYYLQSLGAKQVLTLKDLALGSRPLEAVKFGGAIDNLGGPTLPMIAAHTQLYGNIACIGLAAGATCETSVMPYILRGVSLIGISSNNTPRKMREEIWAHLSKTLHKEDFQAIKHQVISLDEIPKKVEDFFLRRVSGRIIVKI
jgi:acrylyl-CoA reductase (NADPH)